MLFQEKSFKDGDVIGMKIHDGSVTFYLNYVYLGSQFDLEDKDWFPTVKLGITDDKVSIL